MRVSPQMSCLVSALRPQYVSPISLIFRGRAGGPIDTSPSTPPLVLRPALCRLGSPLGVGMPVLSIVMRRASGVATLLPSLWLSVSPSRKEPDVEIDMDWE